MEPSNRQELAKHCTEKVTKESYDLAMSWLSKPALTSEGEQLSPPEANTDEGSSPPPIKDTRKWGRSSREDGMD